MPRFQSNARRDEAYQYEQESYKDYKDINYSLVPEEYRGNMERYIVGREIAHDLPDFLVACIKNDLLNAVTMADHKNLQRLPDIMRFLYNDAPSECWGSLQAYERWLYLDNMNTKPLPNIYWRSQSYLRKGYN